MEFNEYEKALIILGLRHLARIELEKAVSLLTAGNLNAGKECQDRADHASKLADKISRS